MGEAGAEADRWPGFASSGGGEADRWPVEVAAVGTAVEVVRPSPSAHAERLAARPAPTAKRVLPRANLGLWRWTTDDMASSISCCSLRSARRAA